MSHSAITGIILAGGESRRMGKDKGLCIYNGNPLIKYSIDILAPLCSKILISSNNELEYNGFGYEIVSDVFSGIGPIGGIYSCLKKSETENNLIISCDMPHLHSGSLEKILSFSQEYDIVIPQHENNLYEPLAGYYSRGIIPKLEESINGNDFKLINLFNKVRFKAVSTRELPGPDLQFKNFNTPEDLIR